MGPVALFDKSFLQSLSIDESVWFDNFFISSVCPPFYCETLADLKKNLKKGHTPEQYVGQIADKFPEMNGAPCAFHADLCSASLLGNKIPMGWQIPLEGGKRVELEHKGGVVFQLSPEAEAFMRWKRREFLEIEHLFAKVWRRATAFLNLEELISQLDKLSISRTRCKIFAEAKLVAESAAISDDMLFEKMKLILSLVAANRRSRRQILKRWHEVGLPPLSVYAPYAAHVFIVEMFFRLSLAANLISPERASNGIDMSYMFYLPFRMVFISSDKIHRKCAPLFLRDDQEFVWGEDLKKDLTRLNDYYSQLPEDTKVKGIMSFANEPPRDGDFLITRLWDKYLPTWREKKLPLEATKNYPELVKHIRKLTESIAEKTEEGSYISQIDDWMIIEKSINKKKGKWWQLPKDLKES